MKRTIIFFLVVVMIIPLYAFGETINDMQFVEMVGTFKFPWGIEQTDSLQAATEKCAKGTGWKFLPHLSPDNKYLYGYHSFPVGKTLMEIPVYYVNIVPVPDETLAESWAVRPDDGGATWAFLTITFDENIDFPDSFSKLYLSLCEYYGEPDLPMFFATETTLDGTQMVEKNFPVGDEAASAEFTRIVNGSGGFSIASAWYNVTLGMSRYTDRTELTLNYQTSKPMTVVQ